MKSSLRIRIGQIATWLVLLGLILSVPTDLLRAESVTAVLARLGYPPYLPFIIGSAKILAIIVLLIPRTERLREWATSGLVILFTGAIISHTVAESAVKAVPALVFLTLTLIGYFGVKLRAFGRPAQA